MCGLKTFAHWDGLTREDPKWVGRDYTDMEQDYSGSATCLKICMYACMYVCVFVYSMRYRDGTEV
jgi:hypothetical protein